jgi:hypothetical protein
MRDQMLPLFDDDRPKVGCTATGVHP